MSKWLWMLLVGGALWYVLRKPLAEMQARKQAGVTAAVDAATLNGYTTYNTQLYTGPLWAPILKFFRAGAYVPGPGASGGGTYSSGAAYSVQG
jgi:hypothetical protein